MNSESRNLSPWDESLSDLDPEKIEQLIESLNSLILEMKGVEKQFGSLAAGVSPANARSARNLLHYLAVRQNDVRELQERLSSLGLSSLGRAESHVMASVLSVLTALYHLRGSGYNAISHGTPPVTYRDGQQLLDEHTSVLLGPVAVNRGTRIMVTMPSQAADDYELVRDLLDSGMDCMRINCAHDDAAGWKRMIAHLRKAEREIGKKCKVFMDLAGHKLRTGPVERSSPLIRWRPEKDARGRKLKPAVVWLRPDGNDVLPPLPVDATLPVPDAWLQQVQVGDSIEFEDARGKPRRLKVIAAVGDCRVAEADKTAYVVHDTVLCHISSQCDSAGIGEPRRHPGEREGHPAAQAGHPGADGGRRAGAAKVTPCMVMCEMLDGETGRSLTREDAGKYAEKNGLTFIEGTDVETLPGTDGTHVAAEEKTVDSALNAGAVAAGIASKPHVVTPAPGRRSSVNSPLPPLFQEPSDVDLVIINFHARLDGFTMEVRRRRNLKPVFTGHRYRLRV